MGAQKNHETVLLSTHNMFMLRNKEQFFINCSFIFTLYSIMTPLKYHIFENIMENGAFAPLDQRSNFHNVFKSIQNLT